MICKICGKQNSRLFIKDIFDDRYGYPKLFDIYKCPDCQSFSTMPPFDPTKIADLYTEYYPRKDITVEMVQKRASSWQPESAFRQWLSGEHRIHHRLDKANRVGIKVLDIGCGDCSSLIDLKKLGYEPYGIETDNNVAKVRNGLGLNVHIGTIEDAKFPLNSFDIIIANQVVEHVTDLQSFVYHIKKFLAPNGIVILSTPNAKSIFRMLYGRRWIHWHIPYHQQILSKKAMANLFAKNDGGALRMTKSITVSPTSWSIHEINRLRFDAKLGLKNPFWTPYGTIHSNFFGKVIRKIMLLIVSIIGKIANIFGYGNCIIVYAK